tara:strand:- start:3218 stop:3562 length:345 start_codon:yes stop_codon:yes gene_type:complete
MARRDSWTWFMLGVAQLLIGEALIEANADSIIAELITWSGTGTIALGLYFLIFLARHEGDFADAYNKAEKLVMDTDPRTGENILVDNSPKMVRAAWYSIPAVMTFIGLLAWLAA